MKALFLLTIFIISQNVVADDWRSSMVLWEAQAWNAASCDPKKLQLSDCATCNAGKKTTLSAQLQRVQSLSLHDMEAKEKTFFQDYTKNQIQSTACAATFLKSIEQAKIPAPYPKEDPIKYAGRMMNMCDGGQAKYVKYKEKVAISNAQEFIVKDMWSHFAALDKLQAQMKAAKKAIPDVTSDPNHSDANVYFGQVYAQEAAAKRYADAMNNYNIEYAKIWSATDPAMRSYIEDARAEYRKGVSLDSFMKGALEPCGNQRSLENRVIHTMEINAELRYKQYTADNYKNWSDDPRKQTYEERQRKVNFMEDPNSEKFLEQEIKDPEEEKYMSCLLLDKYKQGEQIYKVDKIVAVQVVTGVVGKFVAAAGKAVDLVEGAASYVGGLITGGAADGELTLFASETAGLSGGAAEEVAQAASAAKYAKTTALLEGGAFAGLDYIDKCTDANGKTASSQQISVCDDAKVADQVAKIARGDAAGTYNPSDLTSVVANEVKQRECVADKAAAATHAVAVNAAGLIGPGIMIRQVRALSELRAGMVAKAMVETSFGPTEREVIIQGVEGNGNVLYKVAEGSTSGVTNPGKVYAKNFSQVKIPNVPVVVEVAAADAKAEAQIGGAASQTLKAPGTGGYLMSDSGHVFDNSQSLLKATNSPEEAVNMLEQSTKNGASGSPRIKVKWDDGSTSEGSVTSDGKFSFRRKDGSEGSYALRSGPRNEPLRGIQQVDIVAKEPLVKNGVVGKTPSEDEVRKLIDANTNQVTFKKPNGATGRGDLKLSSMGEPLVAIGSQMFRLNTFQDVELVTSVPLISR